MTTTGSIGQPEADVVAVQTYAGKFAHIILGSVFAHQEFVNGKELSELTPIRQVNLFLLRSLEARWTKESYSLRSPYFDYTNPQVQEALKQFMNVLSQHISLDRDTLKPLLEEAVTDTILLAVSPLIFYKGLVEKLGNPRVQVQRLKESLKYVKTNRAIPDAVVAELEIMHATETFAGEMHRYFKKAWFETQTQHYDANVLIKKMSEILPVTIADWQEGRPVTFQSIPRPSGSEKEHTDFFSQFQDDEQEPETSSAQSYKPVEEAPKPVQPTVEYTLTKMAEPEIQQVAEAPTKPAEIATNHVAESGNQSANNIPAEPANLNSMVRPSDHAALNDAASKRKIEKLKTSIPLNDRFLYIRELFHNDKPNWEHALDQLDNAQSSAQIANEILPYWANRFKWDTSAGTVYEQFKEFVLRRFAG